MKSAGIATLLAVLLCHSAFGQALTYDQQSEIDSMVNDKLQQADAEREMQAMQDEFAQARAAQYQTPADAAAIAARNARYPDIITRVDAEHKATWEKENPFKVSWDMPKTPQSLYDAAIKEAEQQKQEDLQSKIALLEERIASLERARSAHEQLADPQQRGTVTGSVARSEQTMQSINATAASRPPALPKPNPADALTRTLPDGRIMAILGGETLYFKDAEEATTAIEKFRRQLNVGLLAATASQQPTTK